MNKGFVLGSINLDIVIPVKRLPTIGETVMANAIIKNPGGKGANQAVALANQEIKTYMIGSVGKDNEGSFLLSKLINKGIHVEHVKQHENSVSGTAFIPIDKKNNMIFVVPGANNLVSIEQVDCALSIARSKDWFITQLEIPMDIVRYALSQAKSRNLVTVLNPSPLDASFDHGMLEYVDFLILNETETKTLTEHSPSSDEEIVMISNLMKLSGVKNIIITLGDAGAVYCEENKVFRIPAFPSTVVDTTAAGDTFLGAFVAKMIEGKCLHDAIEYANKAASITISRLGAQESIPTKADMKR